MSFLIIGAAFNLFLRVLKRLLGRYFAARKPRRTKITTINSYNGYYTAKMVNLVIINTVFRFIS